MDIKDMFDKLNSIAESKGAESCKLICCPSVVVGEWVRQKCQYGCNRYANNFACPPYSPTPEQTRYILQYYTKALLVHFAGLKDKKEQGKVHDTMFQLEKEAFISGFEKAFAYAAGPCRLCESCKAEEISEANEYARKHCRNPKKIRPSMEACGIDVFQTARNADFEIHTINREVDNCFKSFGLLLLI